MGVLVWVIKGGPALEYSKMQAYLNSLSDLFKGEGRDSNPRHRAPQARVLPLNYPRHADLYLSEKVNERHPAYASVILTRRQASDHKINVLNLITGLLSVLEDRSEQMSPARQRPSL